MKGQSLKRTGSTVFVWGFVILLFGCRGEGMSPAAASFFVFFFFVGFCFKL